MFRDLLETNIVVKTILAYGTCESVHEKVVVERRRVSRGVWIKRVVDFCHGWSAVNEIVDFVAQPQLELQL
jgi:hypothetical protein